MFYLKLPIIFLKFWYFEAPRELIDFFSSLNKALLVLLSLPILAKTFFKPWKNEYRKGLVVFSISIGVFIKTFVIFADLIILVFVISLEAFLFIAFLLWPFATIALIFI